MSSNAFKVSIAFDVAHPDGTPFFTNHVAWEAMDYAGLVLIERKLADALSDLVAVAEQDELVAGASPVPAVANDPS